MPDWSCIRLLVDEDVSHRLVSSLKKLGIDAVVDLKGLKNGDLFRKSIEDNRIFLTHDQDFTDKSRYPASKTCGIIVMKFHPMIKEDMLKALESLFKELSLEEIRGKLIILTRDGRSIE